MFKLSNRSLPDNKRFKLVADILLYTLPLYSVAIAAILPEHAALILGTVIDCVVVTIKAISKFTAELTITTTTTTVAPTTEAPTTTAAPVKAKK